MTLYHGWTIEPDYDLPLRDRWQARRGDEILRDCCEEDLLVQIADWEANGGVND